MAKKVIVLFFVLAVLASPLAVLRRHRSESAETAEANISAPYLRVIASLAEKRNLEAVVASGGAVLVSREWEKFDFDLQRVPRLRSWELRGRGRFVVKGDSQEFHGEATMVQAVDIDRSGVVIKGSLERPVGFVVEHETDMEIANSTSPVLKARSRIVYERLVPFWMCSEVDARVAEYNKSHLYAVVRTIKCLAEE